MNGITKWLKDKEDNILIPNTLTSAVFNAEGKSVDELLSNSSSTNITIDTELSSESENPVQNKVITSELDKKIAILEMPIGQNLDLLLVDNYTIYHANDGHASINIPDDVYGFYDLIVSGSTNSNKYYQQLFNNDKIYFRSAKVDTGINIDLNYNFTYKITPRENSKYLIYFKCKDDDVEYGREILDWGNFKTFSLINKETNTVGVYKLDIYSQPDREIYLYKNGSLITSVSGNGSTTYDSTTLNLGNPMFTFENVEGMYSEYLPIFLDTQTEDILNFLRTDDKSTALNYQETILSWSDWKLLNNPITIDSELNSASTNPVQNKVISAKLDEVFQSVSNGKSKVAAAITDKGVNTAADATFDIMAENIKNIKQKNENEKIASFGCVANYSIDSISVIKEE